MTVLSVQMMLDTTAGKLLLDLPTAGTLELELAGWGEKCKSDLPSSFYHSLYHIGETYTLTISL